MSESLAPLELHGKFRKKKGSLCWRVQGDKVVPVLSHVLGLIADKSECGRGVHYLVELLRRLLFLRGVEEVSSEMSVMSLARLADMLHSLEEVEAASLKAEPVLLIDDMLQSMLKGARFFYADFPPGNTRHRTTLVAPVKDKINVRYPALWIDMAEMLSVSNQIFSSEYLQLALARFIEKTFTRICDVSLSRTTNDEVLKPVSRIVCILDFCRIARHTTASQLSSLTRAVGWTIWAYAPVIMHAVVLYGTAQAGELQWRELTFALNPWPEGQCSSVRIVQVETKEELSRVVGECWKSSSTTFGGFEDETMQRYACDFNQTTQDHLVPGAMMMDNFWEKVPLLRSQMKKWTAQNRLKATPIDPNMCKKSPNFKRSSVVTSAGNSHQCKQAVDRVPCAGKLQTTLDECQVDIETKLNLFNETATDVGTYIRSACAQEALGISEAEILEAIARREHPTGICTCTRSLIASPIDIHHGCPDICQWKGLGYTELYRLVPSERLGRLQ